MVMMLMEPVKLYIDLHEDKQILVLIDAGWKMIALKFELLIMFENHLQDMRGTWARIW